MTHKQQELADKPTNLQRLNMSVVHGIKPRLRRIDIRFLPNVIMNWWECDGGGICAQLDTPEGAYALWKHKINPPQKGLT